ncbi:response regulator transcription factor [Isachenkonia alkalipeptolytica]|uniref:Stage 0 sporulation protein A homolog n=1 Tax=Isachenkonia alkalipeptolytica TaxID=2565777 RepID=A0AA44BER9_9CLOT|nr:helix-turn-helix domain-containing protein [Isachenkonia alkalipeptolytica]NBG89579.1 response regulator [Isachenkonia alkalipeptolytica]
MHKIIVVEDEGKIRRGFSRWIREYGSPFQLAGEFATAEEALESIKEQKPAVCFLDIQLGNRNGLFLAKQIREISPESLLVMITGYDYFEYAYESIKLQVFDYLLKPVPKSDFFKLLERVEDRLHSREGQGEESGQRRKEHLVSREDCSGITLRVVDYVERHYEEADLSVQKLAKMFGVNRAYLSRLMKEDTGYTFTELLTKVRIEKAKDLLDEGGADIRMYDVAKKVGYRSQHYFSRVFHKSENISPSDYKSKD